MIYCLIRHIIRAYVTASLLCASIGVRVCLWISMKSTKAYLVETE